VFNPSTFRNAVRRQPDMSTPSVIPPCGDTRLFSSWVAGQPPQTHSATSTCVPALGPYHNSPPKFRRIGTGHVSGCRSYPFNPRSASRWCGLPEGALFVTRPAIAIKDYVDSVLDIASRTHALSPLISCWFGNPIAIKALYIANSMFSP